MKCMEKPPESVCQELSVFEYPGIKNRRHTVPAEGPLRGGFMYGWVKAINSRNRPIRQYRKKQVKSTIPLQIVCETQNINTSVKSL